MPVEIKKRRSRKKRWRRFREGGVPRGTYIVPNLFTTGNLFSGFFGIINAINGNFTMASVAVFVSCVFDILDGKIARLTRATSRFGVEYDSLADLVAFGVGPGLLIYLIALRSMGRLGWLAAFVFVACGALRLARFNVQVDTAGKKYFVGLPIPGAAAMLAATVLFIEDWTTLPLSSPASMVVLLVLTFALGGLMISTTPFNSFKDFEVVKEKPSHVLFFVIVFLSVVAIKPGTMLFVLLTVYMMSGPVRWIMWQVRGRSEDAGEAQALADAAALEDGVPQRTEPQLQAQSPGPPDQEV